MRIRHESKCIGWRVEVERVEGFSRRQPRFRKIPLEAASASLDHLLFGESGQEASGGPAFLVGGRGESSPDKPDAGKTQDQGLPWEQD